MVLNQRADGNVPPVDIAMEVGDLTFLEVDGTGGDYADGLQTGTHAAFFHHFLHEIQHAAEHAFSILKILDDRRFGQDHLGFGVEHPAHYGGSGKAHAQNMEPPAVDVQAHGPASLL